MVSLASLLLGILLFLLSLAPSGQMPIQFAQDDKNPKPLGKGKGKIGDIPFVPSEDDIVLNSSADLESLRKAGLPEE